MRLRPGAHTRAHNTTPAATDEAPPPCAEQPEVVDLEWAARKGMPAGHLSPEGMRHVAVVLAHYCAKCRITDRCLEAVQPHLHEQSVIAGGMAWAKGVRVRAVTADE